MCELQYIIEITIVRSVITDFGAARKIGSKAIACTKGFEPPEFWNKPLSFESDIYSLGKLFLQLFKHVKNVSEIDYYNFDSKVSFCDFANDFIDCKIIIKITKKKCFI